MKKGLIIVAILAVVAAAGAAWYFYSHPQAQPTPPTQPVQDTIISEQPQVIEEQPQQTQPQPSKDTLMQAHKHQRTIETNKKIVYEPEKVANPLLVGQWLEDGTKHYKIYLDDACDEESYFWGKEWDEAQGILEEDLTYHGNGWFKWSKTHDELTEIYVSEHGNILVPNHYRIDKLNDTTFVYTSFRITQTEYNQEKKVPFRVYHFHRS